MLKKLNRVLGVVFIGVVAVVMYDLDDKLMEKVEPLLIKRARLKAEAAAQKA